MNNKTLVVLAAGMGSRFGGLKQIEPVGPNNEFILDYSIYSAIKSGFNKVVFIIKEENYEIFKNTIGKRIEDNIQVEYAFQKNNILPNGCKINDSRVKPLGTAHAIYCAKDYITDKFAVITSDDFYGDQAFKDLSDGMDKYDNLVIGYEIGSTLSQTGEVKRGVIITDDFNKIVGVIESKCSLESNKVKCVPLNESIKPFYVECDHPVSMLMNSFSIEVISLIEDDIIETFNKDSKDMNEYEFLLPNIMEKEIMIGKKINLINTNSKWAGMTYKQDEEKIKQYINSEIEKGIYPENLWDKNKSLHM